MKYTCKVIWLPRYLASLYSTVLYTRLSNFRAIRLCWLSASGLWYFVRSGPWFNIKMSYQYRKSHCGDKTVVRSSYLHNGISFTGKMASLYWISPLVVGGLTTRWTEAQNNMLSLRMLASHLCFTKKLWINLVFWIDIQTKCIILCFRKYKVCPCLKSICIVYYVRNSGLFVIFWTGIDEITI